MTEIIYGGSAFKLIDKWRLCFIYPHSQKWSGWLPERGPFLWWYLDYGTTYLEWRGLFVSDATSKLFSLARPLVACFLLQWVLIGSEFLYVLYIDFTCVLVFYGLKVLIIYWGFHIIWKLKADGYKKFKYIFFVQWWSCCIPIQLHGLIYILFPLVTEKSSPRLPRLAVGVSPIVPPSPHTKPHFLFSSLLFGDDQ